MSKIYDKIFPRDPEFEDIKIYQLSNTDYPIQKKNTSFEFLRTQAHLRPRTNTFNAVFRVRSLASYALHKFFQENGFVYEYNNTDKLAEKMKILFDDSEKANQQGEMSRKLYEEKYSEKIYYNKILKIYTDLIKEGKNV